jgi:hypothetical protein
MLFRQQGCSARTALPVGLARSIGPPQAAGMQTHHQRQLTWRTHFQALWASQAQRDSAGLANPRQRLAGLCLQRPPRAPCQLCLCRRLVLRRCLSPMGSSAHQGQCVLLVRGIGRMSAVKGVPRVRSWTTRLLTSGALNHAMQRATPLTPPQRAPAALATDGVGSIGARRHSAPYPTTKMLCQRPVRAPRRSSALQGVAHLHDDFVTWMSVHLAGG